MHLNFAKITDFTCIFCSEIICRMQRKSNKNCSEKTAFLIEMQWSTASIEWLQKMQWKCSGIVNTVETCNFCSQKIYSAEKPFLKFFFENFAKLNVKNFRGSSSIRWKIEKSKKNLIFCKKYYFFWLNLYCKCSQLSFEVHNTFVTQNLKLQPFWLEKFYFWPSTFDSL